MCSEPQGRIPVKFSVANIESCGVHSQKCIFISLNDVFAGFLPNEGMLQVTLPYALDCLLSVECSRSQIEAAVLRLRQFMWRNAAARAARRRARLAGPGR